MLSNQTAGCHDPFAIKTTRNQSKYPRYSCPTFLKAMPWCWIIVVCGLSEIYDKHYGGFLATTLLWIIAPEWIAIVAIDILNKKRVLLWSIPSSSLFQYFVINYIFECYWNTYLSYRNWCWKGLLPSVLHKIQYMIFKIRYWTHSGIVFDKCHKKGVELMQELLELNMTDVVGNVLMHNEDRRRQRKQRTQPWILMCPILSQWQSYARIETIYRIIRCSRAMSIILAL